MMKNYHSFYKNSFLNSHKVATLLCCVFVLMFAPIPVLKAQEIEPPKKEKKVKLPPEDLSGILLKNAQYNFSYSALKISEKKTKDKKLDESLILQTASVGTGGLVGVNIENPTSLQFGPDSRLYVSQQNGLILALTIVRNGPNDYTVTGSETISLVNQILNHDDNGEVNTNVRSRQVTGILLAGTAAQPIIYVSSSDSRIGGGSTAGDKNLDTNSGILSRLSKSENGWEKIDLVRGFPRSEENHAVNGMQLDELNNLLYLAVGGFTNAGSPSNNFAFICEYALSAAILSIDLNAIEALPVKGSGNTAYKYDLPTLDDPTRPNNPDGSDVNDPFGGNDGLNQAKLVEGGPVQIFSPGYRNAYDLVITKTPGRANRVYTIDNGANQGWGGHPENEGSEGMVTNNYVDGEPGSTGAGPNDPRVNNLDNLHFIGSLETYVAGSYYGGHPTPTRANPAGAGLYTHDGISGVWRTSMEGSHPLPADWPPVPLAMANPVEGDFRNAGETDGALLTFSASTNGVAEYTASNFDNTLKGHLLAASYDGYIHKITLTEDGTDVTNTRNSTNQLNGDLPFASGFGSRPLDITAQGDNDIFPGTVWTATYGSDAITIFEPAEYVECSGQYSTSLDEDNDGFSNADEIDNGTNPCSAASKPQDSDGDLVSDLNDGDDDNDGLGDDTDYFALDPENGLGTTLPVEYELFNNYPGTGLFGLGFTGLMSNQQAGNDYYNLYDEENLIAGGAVGAFSVVAVSAGDAFGDLNNQENAFQFGFNVNSGTWPFTVHTSLLGPFFDNQRPQNGQSQGIYIGTGDQDNYLKLALNANNGDGGIELVYETAGVPTIQQFSLEGGIPASNLDLYLSVNPGTGTVQAKYSKDGGEIIAIGTPVQLDGLLLNAIQGAPAVAVGIISTSGGAAPFTASWDLINITTDPVTATGQWQTLIPESGAATERHENVFVQAGDQFYLLGGRGVKPVEEYDPKLKSWTAKGNTPMSINHFQAVTLEGLVYVLGAFTGGFPHEVPVPDVYIYNPTTDKWIKGPAIPEGRRRGSAGVVVYKDKIYMVSGILDGHWEGWVPWFDEYDPSTNTWKILADAPRPRDHFHAAVIEDKLYLAGGRRTSGSTNETFSLTVPEVDVYDFLSGEWSTLPAGSNIPTQRAGSTTAVLGDELIVIGGESGSQSTAHQEAEALNVRTNSWRSLARLQVGRHGTQAIVNNNGIYVAAGSGNRGGSPELNSLEAFYMFSPTEPLGTALVESSLEGPAEENFGPVKAGSSLSRTVNLINTTGNQSIAVSSIAISGESSFTFEAPFTLPFVIPAGGSVALAVKFSPTSSGLQAADLVFGHSGTGSRTVVSLKGEGQSEGLVPSPTKLHFFSQQAGTTSNPKLLRLTNHESNQVEVLSVSLSGKNSSEFAHSFTEAAIITAGDSLDLFVTFSPASLGTKVADLTIEHSGPNSPLMVAISGEGHDNPEETVVYRLNSGGEVVTSPEGDFAKDLYFAPHPGHTFSTSGTISGTTNQAIYQSERSATTNNGTFSYAIPVPAGKYNVVLHFAEIYWKDPGKRVFDVSIEEVKMLDNFDIVVKAGGSMTAVKEAFYVEVTDGMLDIFFSAMASDGGVNRPKISAIEVLSVETESNQLPVAHAGDDQVLSLPTNSVVLSGSGTDADGTITAYQWKQESGPEAAVFSSLTVPEPTVSGLVEGIYKFSLTVTDNEEGVSLADEVLVTVQPQEVEQNQLPLVDAGDDKTITLPLNAASFTATASDPDGTIVSYLWEQLSGSLADMVGETTSSLSLNNLTKGTYQFSVTVTDDKGATASDHVNLTVNEAPLLISALRLNAAGPTETTYGETFEADKYFSGGIAKAYSNLTINTSSGTLEKGIYHSERYGNIAYSIPASSGTYLLRLHFSEVYWKSPGKRAFNVTAEGITLMSDYDIFADVGFATAAIKEFEVTVTDGQLNLGFITKLDNAKINAIEVLETNGNDNQAPLVNAGDDKSITLPVNTSSFTATANDPDGTIASYLWEQLSGPSAVMEGTTTATLSLSELTEGSYSFKVSVADDKGATAYDEVGLVVNAAPQVNQLPTANAGVDQQITLPTSSVTLSGSGTDADGSITAYQWKQESGPSNATFSSTTVAKPTVSGLVEGSYVFSLTVTDNTGGVSAADDVLVKVNPNAPVGERLESFTLVNADTDQDIQTITSGAKINLNALSTQNLNIRANTNPPSVGSVVFDLSGKQKHSVKETNNPYALFGESNGDYKSWNPALGNYTLTATPYLKASGKGESGTALTITFSVVKEVISSNIAENSTSAISSAPDVNQDMLSVYPNTFESYINVKVQAEEPEMYQLMVSDLLGRVYLRSSFESDSSEAIIHRLDLSDGYSVGKIYLIHLMSKNGETRKVFKIVKVAR